jgi:hypothetical protein
MLAKLSQRSQHGIPIRSKIDQLDHLPKLCQILTRILDFLQSGPDCVCLVNDLEDRIAHGALMEQVIDPGHLGRARDLSRVTDVKLYQSSGILKPNMLNP